MTERQKTTTASLTDTAGAEQYIPREATEHVLARIEAALDAGDRFIVLSGPPGLGKTLLLHVLEERQRTAREVIFSPFFHFPPDEARFWLRGLLRKKGLATAEEGDPPALPRIAFFERPLLLILDEAQSMPVETAADLIEMLPDLAPGASVLLAGIEGPRLDDVVENIGLPVEHVRLESRFSSAETLELLDRAMPPEAAGSIVSPSRSEVEASAFHAAAEGNPRLLKTLMFRAERGEPPPVLPVESSEARAAFDEAGEGPLALDDGAEPEPARVGIDPSSTTPVEPETEGAHYIRARRGASEILSENGQSREVPEAGSDPTPGQASKPASGRRRLLELLLVATALGAGFLVARFIVPPDLLPTSLATLDLRSLSLPAVSAPPPEWIAPPPERIAPAVAERSPTASAAATPSLDPGPVEEAPAAVVAVVEDAPALVADSVAGAPAVVPGPPPVTLHINARPWASIRLDGETIGLTPLSRPEIRPGRYELEAEFPDGRIVKRVVEVGPDSRFVSFP